MKKIDKKAKNLNNVILYENSIKQSVKEINKIKDKKLKAKPIEELLKELE